MLLFNVFVALNTPNHPIPSLNSIVTSSDLLFAQKKITSSYREFKDAKKSRAYDKFLALCDEHLLSDTETSLLNILYHYLKSSDLYLSDIQATQKLTEIFFIALQNQNNLLSMMSMGRVFIENPVVFAAFLRSLLLRNISAREILSSQLLQDLLRYNFDTLHREMNEVSRFYETLESFPDAKELVSLAKNTCCAEEGLLCYALDGKIRQNLIPIQAYSPEIELSIDELNLNHLHLFFTTHFLEITLEDWQNKKSNPLYNQVVRSIFNQEKVIHTQLPALLDYVQQQSNPKIKQALADILNEPTLQLLVHNKTGSVFSLLPFSNTLTEMINTEDLHSYLLKLREHTPSSLTFISSLFSLFEGVKRNKPEAAEIIVDLLLDALLEDSIAIDDESIHKKLHKFQQTHQLIHQKAHRLEASLHELIAKNTILGLDEMDYITIEDAWREASSKIRCLQRIIMFNTSCPKDKYKLYTTIVSSILKYNHSSFDLDRFCLALEIEPLLQEDQKLPYERLLYELLINIDNDALRATCIQALDSKISSPWRKHNQLFKEAAEAGNIGFIRWLTAEGIKPTETYDTLALDAAQKGQWHIVDYFSKYNLKQSTVNMLLHCAVAVQADQALPLLWQENAKHPGMKEIEQAFKLAVKNNDLNCVNYLISCPNRPSDTSLSNAFKQALKLNHIEVLKIIIDKASGKCLQATIHQLYLNAAKLNDQNTFQILRVCSKKYQTPQLMGQALLFATRAQQLSMVRHLTSLDEPTEPIAIERSYREAKRQHSTEIQHYLSLLITFNKNLLQVNSVAIQHSLSLKQPLKIQPIKHSTSLHTLNAEQQSPRFSFFQPKPVESPVKNTGLNQQSSF